MTMLVKGIDKGGGGSMATAHSTTTYRMKLYCKRPDWLRATKALYNDVQQFYHELLLGQPELHDKSSQIILRELEKLTLTSRSDEAPLYPLPYGKIPVYFRRAAINAAIGSVNIYNAKLKTWEQQKHAAQENGKPFTAKSPRPAQTFNASPLFYKGMYKDLEDHHITLKLWTGSSWAWVKCSYSGRDIPANSETLSPTVVLRKNRALLHIPVKTIVPDARTVKQRMQANENVCGVNFTNYDAFAVCTVYTADGSAIASKFIRGGDQYVHHSKRLLERIKRNNASMGANGDHTHANQKYWQHLYNLSEYWAHKVSREIISFCQQHQVKTIVMADFKDSGHILNYAIRKTGKYTPMYLGLRIRRYLQYKAWQSGIIITKVRPHHTSSKCTICRQYLIKQPTHVKTYRCKGGHTGNKDLNTAKNIAQMGLKKFGKQVA